MIRSTRCSLPDARPKRKRSRGRNHWVKLAGKGGGWESAPSFKSRVAARRSRWVEAVSRTAVRLAEHVVGEAMRRFFSAGHVPSV